MSNVAEQLHEEAHARLSPSGSKKWFACPGSITLEEPIPNVSSTYADDGTAMHEIAARCLTEHRPASKYIGEYVVVSLPHEPVRKVLFDEDMAELVQGYVQTMYLKSNGRKYWVERRVNFSEFCGVPNQFGTADFISLDERDGELAVDDLKTGYKFVNVIRNSQLMCYALGALAMLRDEEDDDLAGTGVKENAFVFARRKGIKTIRLGIYQPRVDGHSEDTITLAELEAFAKTLREKAERVEDGKREHGVIPIENWNRIYLNQAPNDEECAFCRAMSTCPSAQRTLQEFMMDGFDEIISGEATKPADKLPEILNVRTDKLRLELLNRLMKLAPFVEDMILAVRAETERVLLLGDELPDFGLAQGRKGNKKFIDPETVETMLNKQMRVPREHIYNFKLKSPTQLIELTKPAAEGEKPILGDKQWNKIVACITQSDGKPSVKPKAQIKTPYVVEKPSTEGFTAETEEEQLF